MSNDVLRYYIKAMNKSKMAWLPVGTIVQCIGELDDTWIACEGQGLSKENYAKLYSILGDEYAPRVEKKFSLWQSVCMFFKTGKWKRTECITVQTGNVFYLPDLRSRFIRHKEKASGQ